MGGCELRRGQEFRHVAGIPALESCRLRKLGGTWRVRKGRGRKKLQTDPKPLVRLSPEERLPIFRSRLNARAAPARELGFCRLSLPRPALAACGSRGCPAAGPGAISPGSRAAGAPGRRGSAAPWGSPGPAAGGRPPGCCYCSNKEVRASGSGRKSVSKLSIAGDEHEGPRRARGAARGGGEESAMGYASEVFRPPLPATSLIALAWLNRECGRGYALRRPPAWGNLLPGETAGPQRAGSGGCGSSGMSRRRLVAPDWKPTARDGRWALGPRRAWWGHAEVWAGLGSGTWRRVRAQPPAAGSKEEEAGSWILERDVGAGALVRGPGKPGVPPTIKERPSPGRGSRPRAPEAAWRERQGRRARTAHNPRVCSCSPWELPA